MSTDHGYDGDPSKISLITLRRNLHFESVRPCPSPLVCIDSIFCPRISRCVVAHSTVVVVVRKPNLLLAISSDDPTAEVPCAYRSVTTVSAVTTPFASSFAALLLHSLITPFHYSCFAPRSCSRFHCSVLRTSVRSSLARDTTKQNLCVRLTKHI